MTAFAQKPPSARGLRAAFTLVEIMAVMAVIAVLLSVAAVGIQRIDRGQATTSAQAISQALFDQARTTAIGRGTRARLLIHNNFNDTDRLDRERYRRYLAVAVLETNDDGTPTNRWSIVSRGTTLPSGVYFSPEETQTAMSSLEGVGDFGTMRIALPGKKNQQKECFYYEFNAEGVCVDGEKTNADPGGSFVLIGGIRPRNQKDPIMQGNNKVGFRIFRNGSVSPYKSPDQM